MNDHVRFFEFEVDDFKEVSGQVGADGETLRRFVVGFDVMEAQSVFPGVGDVSVGFGVFPR